MFSQWPSSLASRSITKSVAFLVGAGLSVMAGCVLVGCYGVERSFAVLAMKSSGMALCCIGGILGSAWIRRGARGTVGVGRCRSVLDLVLANVLLGLGIACGLCAAVGFALCLIRPEFLVVRQSTM
jgi:hypothetical protein